MNGLVVDAADAIEALSVVVRAQKAVLDKFPRWIPVTERLPECDLGAEVGNIEWISCGMVHSGCFGRGGKYRDAYFRTWTDAGEGMDAKDADYWRAVTLPEPPKDESLDNSEPETKQEYYHAFCSRCGRPVIVKKEEAFWWPGGTTDDHLCISCDVCGGLAEV